MIYILAFVVLMFAVSIFENIRIEKRRIERDVKLAAIADKEVKNFEQVLQLFTTLDDKVNQILTALKGLPPQSGAARVYALLMQRAQETRIYVRPARTFEEAAEKSIKDNGAGWIILTAAHVDVIAETTAPIVLQERPFDKEPAKSNYIADLKYARDTFAIAPQEKKAIDKVIATIEKNYDKSQSAT